MSHLLSQNDGQSCNDLMRVPPLILTIMMTFRNRTFFADAHTPVSESRIRVSDVLVELAKCLAALVICKADWCRIEVILNEDWELKLQSWPHYPDGKYTSGRYAITDLASRSITFEQLPDPYIAHILHVLPSDVVERLKKNIELDLKPLYEAIPTSLKMKVLRTLRDEGTIIVGHNLLLRH
ncbi:MAG: hypothetical protein P8Z33_00910 [Gammaproteobacteria bacterium]|jgi:hypothetical protein